MADEGTRHYGEKPTSSAQEELDYMSRRIENLKVKLQRGGSLRHSMKRNLQNFFNLTETDADLEIDKFCNP